MRLLSVFGRASVQTRYSDRLIRTRAWVLPLACAWGLNGIAQTSYTWNGSFSSAWNNAANWTPGTGFPLAADHAVIVAAGASPVLDMTRSVTNLTVNGGILDLGGFTLTTTGNGTFNAGIVNNGTLAPNSAAGSMNFAGTTFGASVTGTTGILQFAGSTFNAPVTITKTGASNDYSSGNTVFNNTLTLTVTAGRVYPGYTGNTALNGDVVVNSSGSSGGVWMGQNAGTLTLAAGRTITAGTFTSGSLLFRNFTQVGGTPQNIALSGTATLYFQVGSTFNGNVVSTSPGLYFTGTTFNGTVKFTKTGAANEYSGGGNIFQSTAEFVVTGTGTLYPANTGSDQYNGNLIVNSIGTGGIMFGIGSGTSTLAPGRTIQVGASGYTAGPLFLRNMNMSGVVAQNLVLGTAVTYTQSTGTVFGGDVTVSAGSILLHGGTVHGNARFTKSGSIDDWGNGGCTFNGDLELINNGTGILGPCNTGIDTYNGNIIVSNTATASVRFGHGGGTGTLAPGKTITVGPGGYANGLFLLDNFIQSGATAQTITLGPNALMYIRSGCTFGGDLTITANGYYIDGSVFNGACRFTKTGPSNEGCAGGNTFNSTLDLVTTGPGGLFMTDAGVDQFNGNITVSSTSTGGVRFGNGGGISTLAAGRTISIGAGGFAQGVLLLRNFTQLGPTPQTLNLGAAASLYLYNGSAFGGDLSTSSGSLFLSNGTYNGNCVFTKTGTAADGCPGGNVFQGDLELRNMNSGSLYMGEATSDSFNGNVVLSNASTGQLRFGNGGGGGVLAIGKTISAGSGGFGGGLLLFRNFTQLGTTPQAIALGNGATLYIYQGSTFQAPLTTSSGLLYLAGATFQSPCVFTKTASGSDGSPGGNLFNDRVEFVNAAAGAIYMAEAQPDQYNGDLVLNNLSTGGFRFGNSGVATSTLAAGRTITVGSGGFASGLLLLRNFIQSGTTAQNLPLGSTATLYYYPGTVFNGDVASTSGSLYFYSCTFNGTGTFTKSGTGTDGCYGGAVFNSSTQLNNIGSGSLFMAENLGDLYNGDLVLNNTSTGQIRFGSSGIASSTLAAGRTVTVGGPGFNAGILLFRNFIQTGPTPQVLNLGSLATLYFYPGTVFNGNTVSTSGGLLFYQSTFNGTGKFTKTGTGSDQCVGGNVFNGTTELINTSSGILYMADLNGDAYNGDLVLNSTSSGQIRFGNSAVSTSTLAVGRSLTFGGLGYITGQLWFRKFIHAGTSPVNLPMGPLATLRFEVDNIFNGNVVSSSGSVFFNGTTFNGTGKFTKTGTGNDNSNGGNNFNGLSEFILTTPGNLGLNCYTGTDMFNADVLVNNTSTGQLSFGLVSGHAFLANGRTILPGSLGFNSGTLYFQGFTQVGPTLQNLLLGSAATLRFEPGTTFNGDIVTRSASLYFYGSTFNGSGRFTKTGASNDNSNGNCVFNGPAEFVLSGAGTLNLSCYVGTDQFNGDLVLNNTSTGTIGFGQGTGMAVLATGRSVSIGGLGFNAGTLLFRNFTQSGTFAQALALGASATLYYQVGTTFNGAVTSTSGGVYFNGSTFNGNGRFTKTGANINHSSGGNSFNGTAEFINSGTGPLNLHYSGIDAFNGDLVLNSTGIGGIGFGLSTGSGTLIGALGIGSTGFTAGPVQFRNFIKVSTGACALVGGVNTSVNFLANNTINGDITVTAGNLLFNGTTFNGNGVFTKTGTANNASAGGNVFNGDVEINAGGTMTLAGSAADDFNGNATFRRLAAGGLTVNNTFNTTFSKNVSTVGSTGGPVQFGAGTGRTIFDGTTVQSFSSDATAIPNVRNLTLAMTGAGELQLLGSMNVQVDMAFTSGLVKPMAATSTGNGLLVLANGITFSDAADVNSYVDGFVRKIGNTAFSFPVGNAGVLAPIAMGAPASASHHFTAKYVYQDPYPTYSIDLRDPTLHHLSRCEYWILDRTNSTTNVTVTLSYDSVRSCGVTNLSDLVVARWNGSMWKDHGNGGTVGTLAAGTIITAGPVTAFSPFTLASRSAMNPLPIELVSFTATDAGATVRTEWITASERNNERFEVERSRDGSAFTAIGTVDGAGNSQTALHYSWMDEAPLPGTNYYRLKQIDFDGASSYSEVVAVNRTDADEELRVWPNPVVDGLDLIVPEGKAALEARVFDAAGRMVFHQMLQGAQGQVHLMLDGIPIGALFLELRMLDGSEVRTRFLKR